MATDIDRGQQAAAEDTRREDRAQAGRASDRPAAAGRVPGEREPGWAERLDYGRDDYDFGTQTDSYLLAGYQAGQNLEIDADYADETHAGNNDQDIRSARARASHRGYDEEPIWSDTESWSLPGPMTGRGPKNYRRADERICEDVCERLTQHGQIDASNLEVKVVEGEVVLQGTVNRRDQKWLAEDVAEGVPGVREVRNEIRVRP